MLNSARSLFPLRGTGHSSVTVVLPQKSILDFRVDLVQPLLRTVGFVLINPNLSFQFRNPIFGRAKLIRKLLRHLKSMMTVCFGHAGGLVKQSQNGVPCFIELITIVGNRVFRRKRNPQNLTGRRRHSLRFITHPLFYTCPHILAFRDPLLWPRFNAPDL